MASHHGSLRALHQVARAHAAALRGLHATTSPRAASLRGVHRVFRAHDASLRGVHRVFRAHDAAVRGVHRVFRAHDASLRGLHRVEDTGLDRIEVYGGEDAAPDFDAAPILTFQAASDSVALAAGHTHHLVARRRNRYGLLSQNAAETLIRVAADGSEIPTPPSAPYLVACSAAADGDVRVEARYARGADGAHAATQWLIYPKTGGGEPDPDALGPTILTMPPSLSTVRLDRTAGGYANGTTVKTLVRTRRLDADAQRDLTGYAEVDPASYLAVTAARASFSALPANVTAYVAKDYGADAFDDYVYEFTVQVDVAPTGSLVAVWGVGDALGAFDSWTAGQALAAVGYGTGWRARFFDRGIGYSITLATLLSLGVPYYVTVRRAAVGVRASFFSDAARTALVAEPANLDSETDPLRYEYACCSYAGGGADAATGYAESLVHYTPVDSENTASCTVVASTLGPAAPAAQIFFPSVAEQR